VTLIHSELPDDAGGRRHEQAWGYVLAAMTKMPFPMTKKPMTKKEDPMPGSKRAKTARRDS